MLSIKQEKLNDSIRIYTRELDSIKQIFYNLKEDYELSILSNTLLSSEKDSIALNNLTLEEQIDYFKKRADKAIREKNEIIASYKAFNKSYLRLLFNFT